MLTRSSELMSRQELVGLVRLATLAPSKHNTQPWKFSIQQNTIKIFPDLSRRLPVVDPDDHALFTGLGCALENLLIAARHLGFVPEVDYFPTSEPQGCLVVMLKRARLENETPLFKAIPQRQTTRRNFNRRRIPLSDLRKLERAGKQEGVHLQLLLEPEDIEPVTELVKEASRIQFGSKAFVNELVLWMRFNEAEVEAHGDGLAYNVMGIPAVPRWLGKAMVTTSSTPGGQARKCARLIRNSSALLVPAAESSNPESWVNLGRSFERVALAATVMSIRYSHLNMPCEVPETRKLLQRHLGLSTCQPLLLLRLGYADPMPRSPRRPVQEVLLEGECLNHLGDRSDHSQTDG